MHRRRVDVAVFHQAELAGVRVLRQGQHGDRRRQQAIHVVAGLIHRLVFELHHGVDRVASDAGNLRRLRQRQQRRAVRTVREELARLRRHRVVHDGRAGQVEVAAGHHRAALAVRHRVARHEERLVAQFDGALGTVAETWARAST
ncbi:hypothetical protein G6F22_018407 [Rhizopus arrhizus]|nr:hypothetical protein G6F22_018407 [Rhizopus arrhizus]